MGKPTFHVISTIRYYLNEAKTCICKDPSSVNARKTNYTCHTAIEVKNDTDTDLRFTVTRGSMSAFVSGPGVDRDFIVPAGKTLPLVLDRHVLEEMPESPGRWEPRKLTWHYWPAVGGKLMCHPDCKQLGIKHYHTEGDVEC